jgi:hypothetical protein
VTRRKAGRGGFCFKSRSELWRETTRFRWPFARPAENTESRKIVAAQVAAYVAFSENVCVVTPETVLIPDGSSGVGPTLELRRE